MTSEILNQFKHVCDIFADVMANDTEYSDAIRNHSTVRENLKPLLEPDEEFRYIVGYPNYVVTSLGKIINLKTLRLLKPNENYGSKSKGNYRTYFVKLSHNGITKKFYVHQLIANAFLDKPNGDDLVINHINHNTLDNRAKNLEWTTRSENSSDRLTNRWMEYSLDELIVLRKGYKCGSKEYCQLNNIIAYRRKKLCEKN